MRFLRFLPMLAIPLTAAGTLSAPAALASQPLFTTPPTCSVTITSASSSSTTCTGAPSKKEYGVHFLANVDVSGVVVYQCQDATGATVSGQSVRTSGASSTSFTPNRTNPTFTTDPAVLAAAATMDASQAGCASGSTAVNPTVRTTSVQLMIAGTQSTIIFNCTVSDPNGLSGTVTFGC